MKKALIVLSVLAVAAAVGGVRFATGSGDGPSVTSNEAGKNITVQGTHIENGCAYTVGTTTDRETSTVSLGPGDKPEETFGSSGSGGAAPGETPPPSHMISQDRANCIAVFGDASVAGPEEKGGQSASSMETPSATSAVPTASP